MSTGTDTAPYTVIVGTDSILGAHTVTVDYGGGSRWKIDTDVSVFHVTGFKCDGGHLGTWRLNLTADFQGAAFTAELVAEIGPDGSGPYQLVGRTSSGRVTVEQRGSGRLTFERAPDGTAVLDLTANRGRHGPTPRARRRPSGQRGTTPRRSRPPPKRTARPA